MSCSIRLLYLVEKIQHIYLPAPFRNCNSAWRVSSSIRRAEECLSTDVLVSRDTVTVETGRGPVNVEKVIVYAEDEEKCWPWRIICCCSLTISVTAALLVAWWFLVGVEDSTMDELWMLLFWAAISKYVRCYWYEIFWSISMSWYCLMPLMRCSLDVKKILWLAVFLILWEFISWWERWSCVIL